MAADAVALAEQMDRPIVMGHSMGARTAIRAVATRPEMFKGAILVHPPVSGPNRRHYPSAWRWYGDPIKTAVKDSSAKDMKAYCPTWTEDQRALRVEWLHTCHCGAIRTSYDGFHTADIHADVPKLTLSTQLVIAGGAPVIQDVDEADLKALLPSMEVRAMRITSPHGTDVTYKLNTYPAVTEYACTDEPGR